MEGFPWVLHLFAVDCGINSTKKWLGNPSIVVFYLSFSLILYQSLGQDFVKGILEEEGKVDNCTYYIPLVEPVLPQCDYSISEKKGVSERLIPYIRVHSCALLTAFFISSEPYHKYQPVCVYE